MINPIKSSASKIFAFLLLCLFLSDLSSGQGKAVPYRKGDLWGLSDLKGKLLFEPEFERMEFLKDLYVGINNGEKTVFDKFGNRKEKYDSKNSAIVRKYS